MGADLANIFCSMGDITCVGEGAESAEALPVDDVVVVDVVARDLDTLNAKLLKDIAMSVGVMGYWNGTQAGHRAHYRLI